MEEPPEGMGLKHTIETSGYRFFMADKVCWGAWKFHSHLTERMLFRVWQLQKSYSKSYLKVANASAFNRYAYELFGQLGKQFCKDLYDCRSYKALQIVQKWVTENLVWEFQREVLAVSEMDIKANTIAKTG